MYAGTQPPAGIIKINFSNFFIICFSGLGASEYNIDGKIPISEKFYHLKMYYHINMFDTTVQM